MTSSGSIDYVIIDVILYKMSKLVVCMQQVAVGKIPFRSVLAGNLKIDLIPAGAW